MGIREKYIPIVYDNSDTPLSLLELTNDTCRWPIGEPRKAGFHFCGKQINGTDVYCSEHYAIAYRQEDRKYRSQYRKEKPNYDQPFSNTQIAEASKLRIDAFGGHDRHSGV